MRTIKFRAWNTAGNCWQTEYCGIRCEDGQKLVKLINGDFAPSAEVAIEFQQFTGLLDKNGKEIYEGDIVMSPNYEYDPSEGDNPRLLNTVSFRHTTTGLNVGY